MQNRPPRYSVRLANDVLEIIDDWKHCWPETKATGVILNMAASIAVLHERGYEFDWTRPRVKRLETGTRSLPLVAVRLLERFQRKWKFLSLAEAIMVIVSTFNQVSKDLDLQEILKPPPLSAMAHRESRRKRKKSASSC